MECEVLRMHSFKILFILLKNCGIWHKQLTMSIETAFDHIERSGLSHPEKDKLCAFVALETSLADAINLRHTDGFLMEILLAKTGKFNSNFFHCLIPQN